MLIVDTQVHIWKARSHGSHPAHHSQRDSFTKDDLLAEMAVAGVQRAVIAPASFMPKDHSYEAVREHPQQLAIMDGVALDKSRGTEELAALRRIPGVLGLRLAFHTPQLRASLMDGTADWIWAEAERSGMPISVWAAGVLQKFGEIAGRHPRLRLIIDHLAVDSSTRPKDGVAFAHIEDLVALSKHPNVAVKASGVAGYSSQPYPFKSIRPYLEKVFHAFGPSRMFWGTDLTRMPCSYRQCVTHFTEELPFLSESDKRAVMGEAFCRWVGWKP